MQHLERKEGCGKTRGKGAIRSVKEVRQAINENEEKNRKNEDDGG